MTRIPSAVALAALVAISTPWASYALADETLPSGAAFVFTFDDATLSPYHRSKVARDVAGKARYALVKGTRPVAGTAGEALQFSGSRDHIEVTDPRVLEGARSVTVSVWFKAKAYSDANYLVSKEDWDEFQRGFVMRLEQDGRPDFTIGWGAEWAAARGEPLETGSWHHLAGVVDESARKIALWVDGKLAAETATPGPMMPSRELLSIGRGNYDRNRSFSGAIDEVAVFERALTKDEVIGLYERGRSGKPLVAWRGDGDLALGLPLANVQLSRASSQFLLVRGGSGELVLIDFSEQKKLAVGVIRRLDRSTLDGTNLIDPPPVAIRDLEDIDLVWTPQGPLHVFALAKDVVYHARVSPDGELQGSWANLNEALGLDAQFSLPAGAASAEDSSAVRIFAVGAAKQHGALVTAVVDGRGEVEKGEVRSLRSSVMRYVKDCRLVAARKGAPWILARDGLNLRWVSPETSKTVSIVSRRGRRDAAVEDDHGIWLSADGTAYVAAREYGPRTAAKKTGGRITVGRAPPGKRLGSKHTLEGLDTNSGFCFVEDATGGVYLLGATPAVPKSADRPHRLTAWKVSGSTPATIDLAVLLEPARRIAAVFVEDDLLQIAYSDGRSLREALVVLP